MTLSEEELRDRIERGVWNLSRYDILKWEPYQEDPSVDHDAIIDAVLESVFRKE